MDTLRETIGKLLDEHYDFVDDGNPTLSRDDLIALIEEAVPRAMEVRDYAYLASRFVAHMKLSTPAAVKLAIELMAETEKQLRETTYWAERRTARESRLAALGFEEPTAEQRKVNLDAAVEKP